MIEPLPPCPYGKKGRHIINVLIPNDADQPFVLFCSICGVTSRQVMDVPAPMDDLPSDAIAQMTKQR